jgi:hypothetical protein
MSDSDLAVAVYFIQPPFTAKTEQLGCYYFNILLSIELCRKWNAAIVPPRIPLAPRDNTKVELNSTEDWAKYIFQLGSVDSKEVLDYSKIKTIDLHEFYRASAGRVFMKQDTLDVSGLQFTKDASSKYFVLNMPPRWDTQSYDPHIFYNELYGMLPLNSNIIEQRVPEWYDTLKGQPFLGVHWRRGDRGNASLGHIGRVLWLSTEPCLVAIHINKYLLENPHLQWVYVSTNSGCQTDKELLRTLVKKPLHFFNRPTDVKPLDIWKWDLTDLLLCAKTDHLLLSPGDLNNSSAFGRLMYAESLRQNPETALVRFMPYN